MGAIVSLNISEKRGVIKKPVTEAKLVQDMGIEGDAHAGPGIRQVSLLMEESIQKMRDGLRAKAERQGKKHDPSGILKLDPGAFAENITVKDLDLLGLSIGDELAAGEEVLLRVTKIGKECHNDCEIYQALGYCIMPTQGIFCQVLNGGILKTGDRIEKR
ncbi:MAG: MOSC domain-containing protein [Deltaproteobacteria bacterium]|nr:MOSC domain-containing protein [Deltaproteobacteria bacterium]